MKNENTLKDVQDLDEFYDLVNSQKNVLAKDEHKIKHLMEFGFSREEAIVIHECNYPDQSIIMEDLLWQHEISEIGNSEMFRKRYELFKDTLVIYARQWVKTSDKY